MKLALERIEQRQGATPYLYPLDLPLVPDAVTVLLGATRAGKTTLLRVMAGLDKPSAGRVLVDGVDVTRRPVRERNVSMVYQQFINYSSMTVADNIASPMRLRKDPQIEARVRELARKLHIEPFLQRLPGELSGGQQQRVALARALAKNAPLMLLDEPLVNLDYKLREELREELAQLFASGTSTVVYATTEPTEALLLGGHTAVLERGELLQYGPTAEVFHRPQSLRVARAFSDPPMNLVAGTAAPGGVRLPGGAVLACALPDGACAEVTVGIRAGALGVVGLAGVVGGTGAAGVRGPSGFTPGTESSARAGTLTGEATHRLDLPGRVELAEIAGSDTFVHVATALGELVVQLTGVHLFEPGTGLTLALPADQAYVFGADGRLLVAASRD